MTELKTLKDFESNDESVDLLMEIRDEAVKWVKYMENYYKSSLGEQMIFIKEFFNLTEEDLK